MKNVDLWMKSATYGPNWHLWMKNVVLWMKSVTYGQNLHLWTKNAFFMGKIPAQINRVGSHLFHYSNQSQRFDLIANIEFQPYCWKEIKLNCIVAINVLMTIFCILLRLCDRPYNDSNNYNNFKICSVQDSLSRLCQAAYIYTSAAIAPTKSSRK
jgi:hypothetical protein